MGKPGLVIWVILAAGAGWAALTIFVLALCRAAATGATVGVVVAAATLSAAPAQAAACEHADEPFEAAPNRAHEALLCEINRTRRRHDAGRLRTQDQLELAARRHAADMRERRFFSHVSPGGGDLVDRLRRSGYARDRCAWRAGEILAWGTGPRSTAEATVDAWMDSPEHRQILVSRRYDRIGVGLESGTPFPDRGPGVTAAAILGDRRC